MRKITEYYESPVKFNDSPFLRGIGEEFLVNDYFEKWLNYIINDYVVPKEKKIGLFMVCSWGKPYSQSYIHYFIQKDLMKLGKKKFDSIHQIIVSNCGVIPKEFENLYPFCAYDWDPTLEWTEIKQKYEEVLFNRLNLYLEKHESKYEKLCCFLRLDSDSYQAIKRIENKRNLKIPNFSFSDNISNKEMKELTLNGVYEDPDIVLITKTNLAMLKNKLKAIL